MRNRRFPKYPDDTDYTTNSPSYYDDLARKQKLIEMLAKKIWEYEETLDLTLEQISDRLESYIEENDHLMTDRLEQWDLNLEKFPENVELLLQEWLTDGTLDHIINDTIFNWKADKTYVDSEIERLDLKDENLITQMAQIAIQPVKFGAVGDGVTDDTLAIQQAIEYCETNGLILHSTSNKEYLVTGVSVNEPIVIEGVLNLLAKDDNQEFVLEINDKINILGELNIQGDRKSLYGVKAKNFQRSSFNRLSVEKCKLWGMIYLPSGNNNFVQHTYFNGRLCGTRHEVSLTQLSATSNVKSSSTGYGSFTISETIEDIYLGDNVTYFVLYDGEAYKIRNITRNTIEVLNLSFGDGVSQEVLILSGGALNIPKHGDNGVGSFSGLDVISNYGIGVQNDSLYSHDFNNLVAQGNGIGFACNDYTLGASFNKPYFELNRADFVYWNYVSGTMTEGILKIDQFQRLITRIRAKGISDLGRLKVLRHDNGSIDTNVEPTKNPSVTEISPGYTYSFEKSGVSDWEFVLNNDKKFDSLNQYEISLNLQFSNTQAGRLFKVSLKESNGQTIEGNESFSKSITGKTVIKIYKIENDWKINIIHQSSYTSISTIPIYVGQVAVVNGEGYLSVGTNSTNDWKKITNEQNIE